MSGSAKTEKIDKPWGYEIIWARTDRYVGKILHVRKGEALSFQYHRVKEETVRLLSGHLRITSASADGPREEHELLPGDVFHVPPGLRHRFAAIADCDILEVSTPETDDVVRLEDRYGRTEKK